MKNISGKESLAESDLEEGEIPEFEICRNTDFGKTDGRNQLLKETHPTGTTFGRMKDSLAVRISNPCQAGMTPNSIYFPNDLGRYELPPAEGEYVRDEFKSVIRNQVPQNTFYDFKIVERRLKYLHPFQTTYGSVQHIMSKIGETLGRSNDSYYKGRRSNDPRSVIKLNNNIGATFKESGSLFRKLRNSYHKRRRYSESNSDSDREIWDNSKLKNGISSDLRRREEKNFKKKRKAKFNGSIAADGETRKYIVPEKNADNSNTNESKFIGNERLLKAIRELQGKECEPTELPVASDGSKVIPNSASISLGESDREKDGLTSCGGPVDSDDNQENRNYEDFSEKLSVNEDSDDDVELIKLRLLALTSNKRKNPSLTEEKLIEDDVRVDENPKGELTDEERASEEAQVPGEILLCKTNEDNGIDRYELMLRAEALKTALLKKHKHRIEKHKYSIGVNKEKNLPKKKEVLLTREDESKLGVEENPILTQTNLNAASGVNIVISSVSNNEDVCRENKLDESDGVGRCIDSFVVCESHNKGVENCSKERRLRGRRRRLRKTKKPPGLNFNEVLSIKENSGIPEEDETTKALALDSVTQKKGLKESEKKFVLVDSSQLSKVQPTDETRLSLDVDQGVKYSSPGHLNNLITTTSAPKIPETEIQRIIVHLGSDSSDEETVSENHQKSGAADSPKEPENVQPTCATSGDVHSKIVDYEKSVELLLKEARRRIESNVEASQRIPPTPEAVYNHLAPSQRLEYIRLKQKIAETEKLRRIKENASASKESPKKNQARNFKNLICSKPEIRTGQSSVNKVPSTSRVLLPKTNCKESASVVKNILERKKTLTQNRLHLERLKVLWKNIKMEKMIEDKCKNELKRLKIRQNFFEMKVSQQRTKIKKLAEESNKIYEAFQKMNKGLEVIGKRKKSFLAGRNCCVKEAEGGIISRKLLEVETVSRVVEVTAEPKKEEENSVPKIDGMVNVEDKKEQTISRDSLASANASEQLKEYYSPIQRPATGSESFTSPRVDPNTIMCQYDLTGKCNDEECPYQHLRA